MTISLEELQNLIEVKAKLEKVSKISSDGKNLLIRIPKEVREVLKLSKGDKLRWLIDLEKNIKLEVIKSS